jgi:hypothetical protein
VFTFAVALKASARQKQTALILKKCLLLFVNSFGKHRCVPLTKESLPFNGRHPPELTKSLTGIAIKAA